MNKIEFRDWNKEKKEWVIKDGEFLGWGVNSDEGIGSFTAAIVKMGNLSIRLIYAELIIHFPYCPQKLKRR